VEVRGSRFSAEAQRRGASAELMPRRRRGGMGWETREQTCPHEWGHGSLEGCSTLWVTGEERENKFELRSDAQGGAFLENRRWPGDRSLRSCEEMRPQAGVGKLKHAPPMQANDLPLVAQAVSPANHIFSHHLTVAARTGVAAESIGAATVRERLPDAWHPFHHSFETPRAS
jgi:hypothetical protein